MSFDSPRILELRRRVQEDPASIAFAQLAEECRRAGAVDEAVRICEAGLARFPAFHSARVTLGRSLATLGRYADARREFEHVLAREPENAAAAQGLEDLVGRPDEVPATQAKSHEASPATAAKQADQVLFDLDRLLEQLDERDGRLAGSEPLRLPPVVTPKASDRHQSPASPQKMKPIDDETLREVEARLVAFEASHATQPETAPETAAELLPWLERWLTAIKSYRRRSDG